MSISLDLRSYLLVSCFITSLVYKGKLHKNGVEVASYHLYNIFLENDGSENYAQLLVEEVNKMFGTKYLNDEHDRNVVSMNSLNIQNANDY